MNSRAADDIVKECAAFIETDGEQSAEAIALAARLLAKFRGTFTLQPVFDAQRLKLDCGCDATVIHEERCPEQILRRAVVATRELEGERCIGEVLDLVLGAQRRLPRAVDPEVLPIARVAEEALTTAGFNADIKEIDPDGVTLVVSRPGAEKCFAVGVSLYLCSDSVVS